VNPEQTRLGENGRIVIPATFRKALGYQPGEALILSIEDDSLRIQSTRQALTRAQEVVRKLVGPERSLSKELIADRRREAARELNLE
jgi:AbrB family looped-hinge helix DNA binding protein